MTERELIESANAYATQHGQAPHVVMTLQEERLPTADGKRDESFTRLGLSFEAYKTVAKPVTISEAPRDAKVVLPEGAQQSLREALDGKGEPISESLYAKLAKAL